ncbi:MAG: NUDIX hydrolase [Motilibacteraceae bacterium]
MAPGEGWLGRVRELHSIAAAGLAYARSPYDLERYERLRELAALMTAELVDAPPQRLRMLFEGDPGYLTPKLDVRAAVPDAHGRLLMVREEQDGLWTLPGGWADVGESAGEGAVREVREESGYEVVVDRLLGFYERERWGHPPLPFFTLKVVVACRLVGGAPATSHETLDVGWFGAGEEPPLSEGRMSPSLLARVRELLADPSAPADLD